jgi:ADP-glucose pyrophosphorylase
MSNQKRRAIELTARFKRRYDAQILQAKIDYMASLYAPCVLAIVGDEVYSYNSKSVAFEAHAFKARYIVVVNRIYREEYSNFEMLRYTDAERTMDYYCMCYHFNKNLCKCLHTGTTGEYWIATPLADGTIKLTEVKR